MGRYDDEDPIDEEFSDEITDEPVSPEESFEDDEIDEIEEGFMEGYEEGERAATCALCKRLFGSDFIEEEIDGEIYRFCSENHAEAFKRKHAEGPVDEE